jgi:integrase
MAKRRGKGEGTITQRSDGRWMGRVDLGRDPDGRRQRKTVYGATRQAVAEKLNQDLGRSSTGELLTTSTPRLSAWLEDWHATHRDEWRPSTRRAYRYAIDHWIVPMLGILTLEQLKPIKIQRWINAATADGPRQYIVTAHVVLREALAWAMTQRQITYNAAQLVKVPRPTRKPIEPLTVEQGRKLVTAVAGHRLGAMMLMSLTMGLRIGEVSGVSWTDVDLEAGTLDVRQQLQPVHKQGLVLVPLKTAHARRRLSLPTLVVEALKTRRKAQLEERMRAGARWNNTHDLVFTSPIRPGRPVSPEHARQVLKSLLTDIGLGRHLKYHGLRHSAATLLLMDGTPLFDVSRVLGHAEISTTSDIYGHLVPEMAASAATKMDALLKAGKAGS